MSEHAEIWRAMDAHRKAMRAKYGVDCPFCEAARPRTKTNPTILLPQQRCRVDGYSDPRPALTSEQMRDA